MKKTLQPPPTSENKAPGCDLITVLAALLAIGAFLAMGLPNFLSKRPPLPNIGPPSNREKVLIGQEKLVPALSEIYGAPPPVIENAYRNSREEVLALLRLASPPESTFVDREVAGNSGARPATEEELNRLAGMIGDRLSLVIIGSEPIGASVQLFDSQEFELRDGKTVHELFLSRGLFKLRLRLPGYREINDSISVSDKVLSKRYKLQRAEKP